MKLYVCGITYQHELGEVDIKAYKTIKELKQRHKCTEECGIVELNIKGKWIVPQNLFKDEEKKKRK